MARKVIGPTGSRRRRWLFLLCLVVTITAGVIFIPSALAVHELGFQLDGDTSNTDIAPVTGVTRLYDWNSLFNADGSTVSSLPTGFGAATFVKDFNTTTDRKGNTVFDTSDSSTFTVGSKDILDISGWSCTAANNVTDKGDIMNAYATEYTDPSSGHQILYFGLERNANTGDANVAFWFLQSDASCSTASGTSSWSGNHQDGDILVVSAFTKGGSVSTINAYRWNGNGTSGSLGTTPIASGVDCRNPNTPADDTTCAVSNEAPITTKWQTENKTDGVGNTLQNGEFFEGGLDLTNTNLADRCFNTFVGDTRSSQSLTATLYDYARGKLGECTSTTMTTPSITSPTTIPAGGTLDVTDSALVTVTGVSTFSGTVSFHLCGPFDVGSSTLCDSGGVDAGSASVTSSPATVGSNTMTVTEAGSYCWRADFSGDSAKGVPTSSDATSGECFTVTPRQSTLATTAGAGPVDFGNPVTDSATLGNTANHQGSGGPTGSTDGSINPGTAGGAAGGSITFTLYKADCSTLATGTGMNPQTVTSVSGDGTYGPVSFTPDSPGTYHWVASYTGDSPNTLASTHNTACNDTAEDVVVRQIPTTMSTAQKVFPQDSATIASSLAGNALPAGGTVIFRLYDSSANCQLHGDTLGSGGLLYKETKTTAGGTSPETLTTNNTSVSVNANGTYYWYVTYATGDTAHTGRQSNCTENTVLTFNNDSGPGTVFP
jgi:hypothetical protein